jgi:hypothetical protein
LGNVSFWRKLPIAPRAAFWRIASGPGPKRNSVRHAVDDKPGICMSRLPTASSSRDSNLERALSTRLGFASSIPLSRLHACEM